MTPMSYPEIASSMNLSIDEVVAIEASAMNKLKQCRLSDAPCLMCYLRRSGNDWCTGGCGRQAFFEARRTQ